MNSTENKLNQIINAPNIDCLTSIHKCLLIQNLAYLNCDVDQTLKRIKFFVYELDNHICKVSQSNEKLNILRHYFFINKNFDVIPEENIINHQDILIDRVQAKRSGHPLTIGIIFQALACHIGLNLSFVQIGKKYFLKYLDEGSSFFINLYNKGNFLTKGEILELFNHNYKKTLTLNKLKILTFHDLINIFLYQFEKIFSSRHKRKPLLIVYDILLQLDSNNLDALNKRALLLFEMGMDHEAKMDLKRFSYLSNKHQLPQELQILSEKLNNDEII